MQKCIYFLCLKILLFTKQDTLHGHLTSLYSCQNFGDLQIIPNQRLEQITIILVGFDVERHPIETDCEGWEAAAINEKELWKNFTQINPT